MVSYDLCNSLSIDKKKKVTLYAQFCPLWKELKLLYCVYYLYNFFPTSYEHIYETTSTELHPHSQHVLVN